MFTETRQSSSERVSRTDTAAAPSAGEVGPTVKPPRRQVDISPYLYVVPAIALLIVWVYKPLVQTIELSFYDWNLLPTSPKVFVGFQNYIDVVSLPELQQALSNTGLYILAGLFFLIVLPTGIVILTRELAGRARTVYQALIFVPFLVTPIATSAIWRWLFAPEGGLITALASGAGIELGNVFRDPALSIWAVVVIVAWQMLGFGVLVISAGWAGISPDYAEAASTDGATPGQITRRISLPLLSPTLVFLALMTILLVAQWSYPVIDTLTKGGPSSSSTNIYYLLYQFGFQNFDSGLSSAAGTLFFIVFAVIAAVFVELSDRLSFFDN